jgi:hypothetical protein
MKYTVELGSGFMIYIPSSKMTGSAIQKRIVTQTAWRSHMPIFIFLKMKVGKKLEVYSQTGG